MYQGTSFRTGKGKFKMSLRLSKHKAMKTYLDTLDIPVLNSAPRYKYVAKTVVYVNALQMPCG